MVPSADKPPPLVLLVVSDAQLRENCRHRLSAAGLRVVEGVASGAATVASSRKLRPNMIVLSGQLDDVAAIEAVRWLQSNPESATTPIIIIGSKAPAGAAADGLVSVLPRSFTAAQFDEAVSAAMQKRAGNSSNSTDD
jgi:DNA-binding response OmpR family regulator